MADQYHPQADDEEAMSIALDCCARFRLQHPIFRDTEGVSHFSPKAAAASLAALAAERVIDPRSFNHLYNGIEWLIGESIMHGVFLAQKKAAD